MDPLITASLINAGIKLTSIFIEKWDASKAKDKNQGKDEKWMGKNYD